MVWVDVVLLKMRRNTFMSVGGIWFTECVRSKTTCIE